MEKLEIERRFLIRYPDKDVLRAKEGAVFVQIVQDYLKDGDDGFGRRVRSWDDGEKRYFYTQKKKVSTFIRREIEEEVDEKCYLKLLNDKVPGSNTIKKIRCRIPDSGHIFEIDLFEFWKHQAILEVELDSPEETFPIPDYVSVIREITTEPAYTNRAMSLKIPSEDVI